MTSESPPFQDRLLLNMSVICDPRSQILHSFLFLFCAIVTFVYFGMYYSDESIVNLSNFVRMASKDYVFNGTPRSTSELLAKWKCAQNYNYTLVDRVWGPDSICRCIAACSAADGCANLENQCLENSAPIYAHVFAGVSNSYYNVIIALLFIHVSVLLNMTIPIILGKISGDTDDDLGKYELADVEVQENGEPPVANALLRLVDKEDARINLTSHFQYTDGIGKGKKDKKNKVAPMPSEKGLPDSVKPPEPVKPDAGAKIERTGDPCLAARVSTHVTKNMWVRLILYLLLSIGCLIISIMAATNTNNKTLTGQECKVSGCVTQTLLVWSQGIISGANVVVSILMLATKYAAKETRDKANRIMLYRNYTVTVMNAMEDITMAGALMLLVSTFSAQGGTRDDTTLFFDVVLIAFISLMLRVQHDVMALREELITDANSDNAVLQGYAYPDNLENEHKFDKQIMSYFLNTRLFIFAVVIGCSFVFIERIEETTGILDKHSTWNESMRLLVLFACVLPNLCSDVSYEVTHGIRMKMSGVHTAYVGPQFWRRTIYLGYILVLIASSWGKDTSVVLAIKA